MTSIEAGKVWRDESPALFIDLLIFLWVALTGSGLTLNAFIIRLNIERRF